MKKRILALALVSGLLLSMNAATVYAEKSNEHLKTESQVIENPETVDIDDEVLTNTLWTTARLNLLPLKGEISKDNLCNDLEVTIYEGYLPAWYEFDENRQNSIFNKFLTEVTPNLLGDYRLGEGIYSYYVRGDDYYSIIKAFVIDDDDIRLGKKDLVIETGRIGGNGYEPNPYRKAGEGGIPITAKVESQDVIICLWPDEIYQYFTNKGLGSALFPYKPFKTPYFMNKRALHEFTSQEELLTYIHASQGKDMHIYSLGETSEYNFDIPLILFTTSEVSSKPFEQAAAIVQNNNKPTIWYQAQIHGNESAAGEAALAMIQELNGKFGKEVLEYINIVVVPRINVDGSFIFSRYNAQGIDMNRDYLALKSEAVVYLHNAYMAFMPELVIDGHEFLDFRGDEDHPMIVGALSQSKMNDSDDFQIDPATSLNSDVTVTNLGIEIVRNVFNQTADTGLRASHYGTTVNNSIGRAYYGLYGSISILVETRGIGAGSTAFERRVYAQTVPIKSILRYAAENSSEIKLAVSSARQEIVEKGGHYDEDDILVLAHGKSGETLWPDTLDTIIYDMYGNVYHEQFDLELEDVIERGRPRPTAYVFSAAEEWIDEVLDILDSHSFEYFNLTANSDIPLQQYYYAGAYEDGFAAGLYEQTNVTFCEGAIVIPMDQVAGNVIAMLMEPDVNDTDGFEGTLVQQGIVSSADSGDFPLYRFIQDNPRALLPLAD